MATDRLARTRVSAAPAATPCEGRTPLAAAALQMSEARGRARQIRQVFSKSMIPMVIVDNDRRYLEANRAARLLMRMSVGELRGRRIDDLTPSERLPALADAWRELLAEGHIAGRREVRFRDGSHIAVVYCRLANLLPGEHLSVFVPADWSEDELGSLEDGSARPLSGPLSPREREVLSLVAAGADLQQIADELTISHATVRTHLGNTHRKLSARNRPHAVALAMQQGLIDLPSWGGSDGTSF